MAANNHAALTKNRVDALVAVKAGRTNPLTCATAKFMSQRELFRLGVAFGQLPCASHRVPGV